MIFTIESKKHIIILFSIRNKFCLILGQTRQMKIFVTGSKSFKYQK